MLLCLCCFAALRARSLEAPRQVFQATNPGAGYVTLSGPWYFHTGDDSAWAGPALNASKQAGWTAIQPDQTWGSQGFASYTGYAWYRAAIHIDPGPRMAVLIPPVDDTYELFWNGSKIGDYSSMPPHPILLSAQHSSVFALPFDPSQPLQGLLALRVWKAQLASNDPSTLGGLNGAPILGDPAVLELMREQPEVDHARLFFLRSTISSIVFVAGLLSLFTYLGGARTPIYLWLATYLICDSGTALLNVFCWFRMTMFQSQVLNGGRSVLCNLALWFILLHLFGMAEDRRWQRITLLLVCVDLVLELVDCTILYFWQHTNPLFPQLDGLTTAGYTLIPAYLFILLWVGLRRHLSIDLWPLAVSLTAYGLYQIVIDGTTQGERYTGLHLAHIDQWTFSIGGSPVGIRVLLDVFFLCGLLLTVERRQRAERRRQSALEQEIKSARELQRLLVPADLPHIPGYAVDAVYHPAQEVGGDFFQILPAGDGMLVILGDVSGKGLKAAMTVSLIVGTLRTLAGISESPELLLAGLNRGLLAGAIEGFATCVVLQVEAGGRATLANAGHLSPFINGRELAVAGSLPLGLVADMSYDSISFMLAHGDRLMLYTDGVLEAQNSRGELFGFERVQQMMAQLPTAEQVKREAIVFGQEDDITVLSLVRS